MLSRVIIPVVILLSALTVIILTRPAPQSELTSSRIMQEILTADGQPDLTATSAIWDNKEVGYSPTYLEALKYTQPVVLGANSENKWIEVDLTTQTLYAHEGSNIVYTFPVSTGLPWMPTVTGDFNIWAKVFSQRMKGGSKENGTYYDLPNVPYVQYFYKGYGLHGTYWHHDFGHPRSHGCVNLSTEDAKTLYYWTLPVMGDKKFMANIPASVGTRVIIHGTTPNP